MGIMLRLASTDIAVLSVLWYSVFHSLMSKGFTEQVVENENLFLSGY